MSNFNTPTYEFLATFKSFQTEKVNEKMYYNIIVATEEEYPQILQISINDRIFSYLNNYNINDIIGKTLTLRINIRSISGFSSKTNSEYFITKYKAIYAEFNDEIITNITNNLPKYEDVFGKRKYDNLDDMIHLTDDFLTKLSKFKSINNLEFSQLLPIIETKISEIKSIDEFDDLPF